MEVQHKRILTFAEGCALLGYKKSYVYELVQKGILPHSKIPNGRRIFFDREKIEAWLFDRDLKSNTETNEIKEPQKQSELESIVFKSVLSAIKINKLSETISKPTHQENNIPETSKEIVNG